MAWSRNLEPGIIQTQSYWSVLGFLCEMLPTAEQAVSLNLKGNEAYSIKVSVNPSLITFEPDGQLKKKKKQVTRRLKSLQPEVPKSFQKKSKYIKRKNQILHTQWRRQVSSSHLLRLACQAAPQQWSRESASQCTQGISIPTAQDQPQYTLSVA